VRVKQFKVIAMFDYPEIERSVLIRAIDSHQALLRAVLEQRLPIAYRRDSGGNLQPAYWQETRTGNSRWPRIEHDKYLTWTGRAPGRLRFEVIEID
jgi:hypothetical protein